jgi:NitT/TauT family transport system substrate-binding protein
VNFTNWANLINSVAEGELNASFLFAPTLLGFNQKKFSVKCLLLGHRNGSSFIVTNDSVETIPDLTGKKIAVPSKLSTHKILLSKLLQSGKINPDNVEIIYLNPYQMNNALRINEIDAFFVAEPYGAISEVKNFGDVFTYSKNIEKNHICCVFCVDDDFMKKNSGGVKILISKMMETANNFEKKRTAYLKDVAKIFGLSEKIIKVIFSNPQDRISFSNLKPSKNDFKFFSELMIREKLIDKFVYEDHVDESYV